MQGACLSVKQWQQLHADSLHLPSAKSLLSPLAEGPSYCRLVLAFEFTAVSSQMTVSVSALPVNEVKLEN